MRKTIVKGFITLLTAAVAAAISGYASYKAGEVSKEQEFNNQIKQEINLDNGDISGAVNKLVEENKELRQEINELEDKLSTYESAEKESASAVASPVSQEAQEGVPNGVTELKDLPEVDSRDYVQEVPFTDSYGNDYEIGYKFDASYNAYAVFGLKGQYTTFSAKVVCGQDTGSGTDMKIYIYKDDDELLDTITHIDKTTETLAIGPYDITGARNLTIKTANDGSYSYGRCCLVDAYVQ